MAAPLDMRQTCLVEGHTPCHRFPHHSQQDNTVLPAYQVHSDQRVKPTTITGITMVSQIGHKEPSQEPQGHALR